MNKLKIELPLPDLTEDTEGDGVRSPDESLVLPNGELTEPEENLSSVSSNNNNTPASQAYGGARPKTIRARLRNNNSEVSSRSRPSDTLGVEIKVISCDNSGGAEETILPHQDIINLPRLESRSVAPPTRETVVEENTDTITEDDCYVYTYIGGTAYLSADLPNSFFRLDSGSEGESLPGVAGAGQSNLSTGVAALIQDQMVSSPLSPAIRSFSPDQDFIEMDFDPGFESDEGGSNDSGQGGEKEEGDEEVEVEDREEEEEEEERTEDEEEDEARDSSESPAPVLVLESASSNLTNNNNTLEKESSQPDCVSCNLLASPTHPSSAPVISPSEEVVPLVLPRSRSLNSHLGATGGCLVAGQSGQARRDHFSLCGSRLMQREALMFGGEESLSLQGGQEVPADLMSALYRLTMPETPIPLRVNPASNRAMIWTEKEAVRKQINQAPHSSSCGAVALVNVVLALELDTDPVEVGERVTTRQRRPESSLPDYLLSRSQAGCTHQDLITAAALTPRSCLTARFFPTQNRELQLCQWLAGWISLGLVPVLTINVQRSNMRCPDGQPQDSWHHQMVWGVSGKDVYLANPLEITQEHHLLPQLDSPSELLVRRADVITRFSPTTDLMEINSLGSRWRDMNVLGQVVNVLREERSLLREVALAASDNSSQEAVMVVTPHVKIPASYTAGVTLFCSTSNQEGMRSLGEASDLPIRGNRKKS